MNQNVKAPNGRADEIAASSDGKHIPGNRDPKPKAPRKTPRAILFNVNSLRPVEDESLLESLGYASVPAHICMRTRTVLGFLPDLRLLILGQDLCICTYRLESNTHGDNNVKMVQRLYFILRD